MNKIAVDELGILLPPGLVLTNMVHLTPGRPAVLRFSTPFYYRQVDHTFHVTMIADRNQLLNQDLLSFVYEVPESVSS